MPKAKMENEEPPEGAFEPSSDSDSVQSERIQIEISPEQIPPELLAKVTQVAVSRSGPLPPAEDLHGYNTIIPNGAERIMAMAERAQEHGQKMESRDSKRADTGMWMGLAGLFTLTIGAAYCVSVGDTVAAGLFLGTGALGVISRFLPAIIGRMQ